MIYELKFQLKCFEDFEIALEWYSGISINLGERFKNEIKRALVDIEKSPFFQVRYDEVRCYTVKLFPNMIHFFY
jgi:toxin ParE1/3/4